MEDNFAKTAKHLLPLVPAYKKMFQQYNVEPKDIKSVEDWHTLGLPLFKKSYYMRNPKDFMTYIDPEEALQVYRKMGKFRWGDVLRPKQTRKELREYCMPKMPIFSGGTETGHPVPAFITGHQKKVLLPEVLRKVNDLVLNLKGTTTGMNLFPYAPHLGWHAVHIAFDNHLDMNLATAAGGALSTERLVEIAREFKPNVIAGMAGYLRHRFLPMIVQKKIKLPENTVFINSAEKMDDQDREDLLALAAKAGAVNARAIDIYGASEMKTALLPECKQGTGFHHIASENTIIRTVRVNEAGKGDYIDDWDFSIDNGYITIWNTDGAGTLLEGYMLGDHCGRVEHSTCPYCRFQGARFKEINRIKDVEAQLRLTGTIEAKVKGTRINLIAIREKIRRLSEVQECQVVVKRGRKDKLIIRVAPKTTVKKVKEISKELEVKPEVQGVAMKDLTKEKFKFEPIKIT